MKTRTHIINKLSLNCQQKVKMPSPYEGGCSYRHCICFLNKYASPCIAIMARSLNRSIIILLRSQLLICLINKKVLSTTVLPTRMTHKQYLKFSGEPFCCDLQSDLFLINLPWKCAGGSITGSYFSFKQCLSLLSSLLTEPWIISANAISRNVKLNILIFACVP